MKFCKPRNFNDPVFFDRVFLYALRRIQRRMWAELETWVDCCGPLGRWARGRESFAWGLFALWLSALHSGSYGSQSVGSVDSFQSEQKGGEGSQQGGMCEVGGGVV